MNIGIDPKWGAYLGLAVIIEQGIGHGTVSLTNLIPLDWAPYVTSWANFLAFVGTSIMTYQAAVSSPVAGPAINTPIAPAVKAAILLAVLGAVFAFPGDAKAQVPLKTPQQIISDLKAANARLTQKAATAVGIPATDPAAAVPCDFKMLTKLTPENLIPTQKACLSDVAQKLVNDTQRALVSAKAYVGPNGGNPGDGDGINCLTPGLAIFKAGVQVPAQNEVPAIMSVDGLTVITPEVMAAPAQDPGPILLYQKYREFTLAGGLTACQTWFNGPINATAAAGIAGAGTIVAGAALLAPK